MHYDDPIGVFDSGVGGISVWKELVAELPHESVVYFADSGNCPYGHKSKNQIINLSERIVQFLISKKTKLIIVACNTATAAAIDYLRLNYNIPFVGMEPAVKPASLNSRTKSIAVLATEGTFNGRLYQETSQRYAKDVELHIQVGQGLVDIVEADKLNESTTLNHVSDLLKPIIEKNIDHLVLGCTHYPLLINIFRKVLPSNVNIIDPSSAVVKQAKRLLDENKLLANKSKPDYEFFTTGNKDTLERLVRSVTNSDYTIHEI